MVACESMLFHHVLKYYLIKAFLILVVLLESQTKRNKAEHSRKCFLILSQKLTSDNVFDRK